MAFQSNGNNIVVGDSNGTWDCFVRDMQTGLTERISLTAAGAQATDRSDNPVLSADARFVVFESDAALVPGDANGQKDVYLLDRQAGQLSLVSVAQSGLQGNGWSYHGDVSDDGRFVCFTSGATNLVPGDTNGAVDMFWKDMQSGELRRVNVSSSGAQANGESTWPYIAGDGRTVAYCSSASNLVPGDSNGEWDLFAYDVAALGTERITGIGALGQSNDSTRSPLGISSDGRRIVFASTASNLVPGDLNGAQDIFLHDRSTQSSERVNLNQSDMEANDWSFVPAMSSNGRFITYTSDATDIVAGDVNGERDIFARDLAAPVGSSYCGPAAVNSSGLSATISASGSAAAVGPGLTLRAAQLPTQTFTMFLCSRTQGSAAIPGSVGLVCLGGTIGRFTDPAQVLNSGAGGSAALQVDLSRLPEGPVFVSAMAGDTWNFQAWFRDVAGGMATSNLTDGVSVTLN